MDHTLIEETLAALVASNSRELERDCDRLAQRYVESRVEPQFAVRSADFATDPYLICADRYWNLRFTAEPTLQTAVECAGWLREHVAAGARAEVREKWALGYAFITRDSVESLGEIADATGDVVANDDSECSRAYFATLYHAGKLRANRHFDELNSFLESSPLSNAAGTAHRREPLFVAMQAFAAFGSRRITLEHAKSLFDRAWHSPQRTRETVDIALNAIAVSVPFDGQGEMLKERAVEAISRYPDRTLFHYRLATGLHMCGEYDAALESIDDALRLLPATGWRVSHELLQAQYLTKQEAILHGRIAALQATAQQEHAQRQERELATLADTMQRTAIRAIELVSVFAAVIAFAVGSLNVSLNGNLRLAERLWIVALLGGGLVVFALLVVGGTWLIVRRPTGRGD
ncbi:hypothetical protein [Nocardia sp. NPDC052566]|uniref:hypothetical protein n=1 Tax=Nocardia sp. NPDC052566 TaxID=3364330 RepID=UPI0037C767CA